MKIISLIASSTEIVCALGFRDSLVGRSHECDFPETVKSLPVCSKPRFDIEGTSKEIDDRVKETLKNAPSVYEIDREIMKKLAPDVIVTQDHCEVCAVSLKDVEQVVCEVLDSRPEIVALLPNSLEDTWKGVRKVAKALKVPEKGEELITNLTDRMKTISEKAQTLKNKPNVACIEWTDPMMCAGNWVPELVTMLGAQDLFGQAGKHSPWMQFDELVNKDPEIILIMPCGWDIPKSFKEMKALLERKEWQNLKAVQNGKVFVTDGNQYFNRPGPRLVESLEIMAEIFYPNEFNFGHKNKAWKNLNTLLEHV